MNQTLQNFYDAYGEWLQKGAPTSAAVFSRSFGLCKNLIDYIVMLHGYEGVGNVLKEMAQQFTDAGLSDEYPFGGIDQYCSDQNADLMHLNPERCKWVFEHMSVK